MKAAEAGEFRIFETRNHLEDAGLRAVFQLRLETDHVVERAERIVLTELHDGISLHSRIMGVGKAHRLHRPMTQGFRPAFSHHLDRQAAVEIGCSFPFLEVGLVAFDQCGHERLILLLVHGAVDVVFSGAAGANLVIARLEPADIHIDRIKMDNWSNGIEEGQSIRSCLRLNGLSQ